MPILRLCSNFLLIPPLLCSWCIAAEALPYAISLPAFNTGYTFSASRGSSLSVTSNASNSVIRGFSGTNVTPVTSSSVVNTSTPVRVLDPNLPFKWAVEDDTVNSINQTTQKSISTSYGASLSVFPSQ